MEVFLFATLPVIWLSSAISTLHILSRNAPLSIFVIITVLCLVIGLHRLLSLLLLQKSSLV